MSSVVGSPNQIVLPAAFDAHVHLRQGDMLRHVAPISADYCDRVLVMPNIIPAVITPDDVIRYREECEAGLGDKCKPVMVAQLTYDTTAEMVHELFKIGCVGLKLYPKGVTTHSAGGIDKHHLVDPTDRLLSVFEAMEELDMILLCHGEMPETFCLDREKEFLRCIDNGSVKYSKTGGLLQRFPFLRVILEHITTKEAVEFVATNHTHYRIAATITLHHLFITLDDVIGDKLKPDNFCKPVAKRYEDRLALQRAARSGLPCFFLGSDSAPHMSEAKYCSSGCAGVYAAPVLLSGLLQFFGASGDYTGIDDILRLVPDYISGFASKFYNIKESGRKVVMERNIDTPWMVPDVYDVKNLVPFFAGQKLDWRQIA